MKFALLGEKLGHSFSPIIHKEIFKDFNIEATYELKEIKKEEILDTLNLLKTGVYNGFNVTIPYKKEVMKYLDIIDDKALEIGAVNTIKCIDGKLIGYNTDYYGFKEEVIYNNIDVKGKNCYILGTGGASLALDKALRDLGANTYFVSRNPSNKNTISYDELNNVNPYLIVNSTPVGMYPNCDSSPIDEALASKAKYVMDIIFNPLKTKLLQYANSNMNGLFMLVGQAIKAEEIWHGKSYNGSIEKLLKRIEMIL